MCIIGTTKLKACSGEKTSFPELLERIDDVYVPNQMSNWLRKINLRKVNLIPCFEICGWWLASMTTKADQRYTGWRWLLEAWPSGKRRYASPTFGYRDRSRTHCGGHSYMPSCQEGIGGWRDCSLARDDAGMVCLSPLLRLSFLFEISGSKWTRCWSSWTCMATLEEIQIL